MDSKYKLAALVVFMTVGLGLTACNPDEKGIDPKILEQLKAPCNGDIHSAFHESATGWTLSVSCTDQEKLQEQRDNMFEGMEKIEPRDDGFNPLDY